MRLALSGIGENRFDFGAEYQNILVPRPFRTDDEHHLNHQPRAVAHLPVVLWSLSLSGVLNSIPFDCHLTL